MVTPALPADVKPAAFTLWHGAQRWDGVPGLRAPRVGHAEHGAGLYCTTEYATARKYAAGAGSTRSMTIDGSVRLLEGMRVHPDVLLHAVKSIPRLRAKQAILDDIGWCAERSKSDTIGLNTIINLAAHHKALSGSPAVAISEFVAAQGADASLYERHGEDWLVVFNPAIVLSSKPVRANDVDIAMFSLPRVREILLPVVEASGHQQAFQPSFG